MTLQEIRNIISLVINQDHPNVSFGVDRYNLVLKMATIEYFKQWTGLPEQWQPGAPVSTRGMWVSTPNVEALRPFIVLVEDQTVDSDGKITLPGNFVDYDVIGYNYDDGKGHAFPVPVDVLMHNAYYDRVGHPNRGPTKQYPICTFYNTYIQLQPVDLMNVDFTYLRLPTTPIYALKQENGIDVYDSTNSVQLDWDARYHVDIVRLILGYLGIPVKDMNLLNYIETKKKEGI